MKTSGSGRRHGSGVEAPRERAEMEGSPSPPAVRGRTPGLPRRPVATWAIRVWSLMKLSAGLALVVGISVAVAWGAHHYASTTPRFAVRTLDVQGNRRLGEAEVTRRAGVAPGTNLFVLDTEAAERALLEDPWIQDVVVSRELPSTLRIVLTEREPVAIAELGGRSWLVTADGVPFKELAAEDPFDLPHLTGIGIGDLAADRAGATARLRLGVEVLRQYARTETSRVHVAQEVNLTADGRVVLTAGKEGLTMHLGRGPFRQRLLMADRVVAQLRRRGRAPGILFLDNEAHPERVVARMR